MYLRFIGESPISPRQSDKNSPIHQDYTINVPRPDGDLLMHIILLDGRYEYNKATGDRLGDQQWKWLDNALGAQKSANLTLILSGVLIL